MNEIILTISLFRQWIQMATVTHTPDFLWTEHFFASPTRRRKTLTLNGINFSQLKSQEDLKSLFLKVNPFSNQNSLIFND